MILTDLNFTGKYTRRHTVVEIVYMLSTVAMLGNENRDLEVSSHHVIHISVI